jgi:DNA-binding NarL/FixJ family response regulator
MAKIRVVLADDSQSVVSSVRRVLGVGFDVVDTAEDGAQAIDSVHLWDPDVLVIDISMPVLDGLETVRRLSLEHCRTKIVFLTIHEDKDFVEAALSAGASGYVTKNRLRTDLVVAIHNALDGRSFVSSSILM